MNYCKTFLILNRQLGCEQTRVNGMAIKEALIKIVDQHGNLSREEASEVMREIMRAGMDQTEGTKATEAQFGALLTALRMKGESVEEIVGMAVAMREFSKRIDIEARPLLDTAGTGGSGKKRFNASTAAAFVAFIAFLLYLSLRRSEPT